MEGTLMAADAASRSEAPWARRAGPAAADPLWARIEGLALDEADATLPFSKRLERDHLWTPGHTARVIGEYRRFLYLAATGSAMATPSEDVDEAWHLHLCHTRAYWQGFCAGVLGRPLHHEPTSGAEDTDMFRDAYAETLRRYRDAFGEDAPPDIWPPAEERFDPAGGGVTVPLRDFRVMRRRWPDWFFVFCGVLALLLFIWGGVMAARQMELGPGLTQLVIACAVFIPFLAGMSVELPGAAWFGGGRTARGKYVTNLGRTHPRRLDAGTGGCGGGCGGCGG
jgi:hypothetical protein